jgi:CheY-like chemotaxis protein
MSEFPGASPLAFRNGRQVAYHRSTRRWGEDVVRFAAKAFDRVIDPAWPWREARSSKASMMMDGKRILVVEDEFLVAEDLHFALKNTGARVLGPVGVIAEGLRLLDASPDVEGAVLDINLGGIMAYPIAEKLLDRNIPFIFTTAYDPEDVPERFCNIKFCQKPTTMTRIIRTLQDALEESPANPGLAAT